MRERKGGGFRNKISTSISELLLCHMYLLSSQVQSSVLIENKGSLNYFGQTFQIKMISLITTILPIMHISYYLKILLCISSCLLSCIYKICLFSLYFSSILVILHPQGSASEFDSSIFFTDPIPLAVHTAEPPDFRILFASNLTSLMHVSYYISKVAL